MRDKKGRFLKRNIPHNKGKTKENYEPLKIVSEKVSETKKRLYKEGKIKPTKYWEGKTLSEGHRKKLSLAIENRKKELGYVNSPAKRKAISEGRKGIKLKPFSKQARKNIGISATKSNLRTWKNPIIRQRRIKGIKKKWVDEEHRNYHLQKSFEAFRLKPNKPEKVIINLIQQHTLPFNYVGDGKIWFRGNNYSFNPDFLSKNPKYIIEIFGDYWHNLPNVKKRDKERLKTYKKYGYKTLVIWEHELKDINQVLTKIKIFYPSAK